MIQITDNTEKFGRLLWLVFSICCRSMIYGVEKKTTCESKYDITIKMFNRVDLVNLTGDV